MAVARQAQRSMTDPARGNHAYSAMRPGAGQPGRRQSRAGQMTGARSSRPGNTADRFPVMPKSAS
jgi:hypothetical protein